MSNPAWHEISYDPPARHTGMGEPAFCDQGDEFWDIIDQLKDHGAEGILVVPIEKMIV